MSGEDCKLKVHITYGGVTSMEENKFSYKGGIIAKDMLIDPDFLTFSIFEDFSSNDDKSNVVKVWYRLPNEDISVARCIFVDKDNEIRKMWSEAKECGEVYIYVEHSVPEVDELDGENLVDDIVQEGVNEDCLDDDKGSEKDSDSDRDYEEGEEESDEEEREEESDDEVGDEQEVEDDVVSEDDNQILGEGTNGCAKRTRGLHVSFF